MFYVIGNKISFQTWMILLIERLHIVNFFVLCFLICTLPTPITPASYFYFQLSTSKPLQEMNTGDVIFSLSKQMSNLEEMILENKNEIASKLQQVFVRMSEIEKSCYMSIDDVSDRLQLEKIKLLVMDNHLLFQVLEEYKKALETFKQIVNVESEVSRNQARADLLQVRTIKFK